MNATLALARTEGMRLLRNPAIWLSFVLTGMWAQTVFRNNDRDDAHQLLVGYGLVVPGLVMVIAVVLAVLRSRMEGADELLDTLSVGRDRRSVGHSLATIALAGVGVVATLALMPTVGFDDPLGVWEPAEGVLLDVPRPNLAQLAQGPLAIVAVATFAIALVRWIPSWLVLLPLAPLTMIQGLFFGIFHGVTADGARWLFPLNTGVVNGEWFGGCGTAPDAEVCDLLVAGFDGTTPWVHAGYLVALAIWFTTLAVLRHRRDRAVWMWTIAATIVLVTMIALQFAVADTYTAAT